MTSATITAKEQLIAGALPAEAQNARDALQHIAALARRYDFEHTMRIDHETEVNRLSDIIETENARFDREIAAAKRAAA